MKAILRGILAVSVVLAAGAAVAADHIILQSTTSTQNSGLYDHILPLYESRTGIQVRVVAVGTGQAIKNAKNCDGDVLLVHAKPDEEAFVAEGYGEARHDVMYNDFVIVGPENDPAGLMEAGSAIEALMKIESSGSPFASRADESGTHKKELALWSEAGIEPANASGGWYRETGTGMGATLNIAVAMDAYVMTDRATWVAFGNKGSHRIVVEGDSGLFNQYGVILVSQERCPRVRAAAGQDFIDWLIGPEGQKAISGYRRQGQQLFFPNAAATH